MSHPKKPHRIKEGSIVVGVCTGLASYFALDVFLIRAAFIFLVFFGGAGIIVYFILAFLMPMQESSATNSHVSEKTSHDSSTVTLEAEAGQSSQSSKNHHIDFFGLKGFLGLTLLVIGALSLFRAITGFALIRWDILWPVVLIFIGGTILAKTKS